MKHWQVSRMGFLFLQLCFTWSTNLAFYFPFRLDSFPRNVASSHSFLESTVLWFVFPMSSERAEALIYKKKKSETQLSQSALVLTYVTVSHTSLELTMLMRSQNHTHIPKGSVNFSQRNKGLFTTHQSSVPGHLKEYWSQKDRAQEWCWPINNTNCVAFSAICRIDLIYR